jgi:outer membrane lipoprotein-sorting protein
MNTEYVETISSRIAPRAVASLIAILMVSSFLAQPVAASDEAKSSPDAPLSLDQIVDNLVRKNAERSRNLLHSEATRVYHLSYRGFPGNREAEMTVEASYDSPADKEFKIVSQTGSKIILDRVFTKLLEAEKESVQPEIASRTQLNRENYEFALVTYNAEEGQYALQVTPKRKSKYVYRGKIWVDATDFAVTRIEAEPAQNPSFWTKKSEVHHEYQKIENSWVPTRNESISYIRLGGRATLTIEYRDYRLTEAHTDVAVVCASSECQEASR